MKTILLSAFIMTIAFTGYTGTKPDNIPVPSTPISTAQADADVLEAKKQALAKLRNDAKGTIDHGHWMHKVDEATLANYQHLLGADGVFADQRKVEQNFIDKNYMQSQSSGQQNELNAWLEPLFRRIWNLVDLCRKKKDPPELKQKIFAAIIHYGKLENSRANGSWRFLFSSFLCPIVADNAYFCFFDDMTAVEDGREKNPLIVEAHDVLCKLAFQAWAVPNKNDATDKNIICVDRFRGTTWWVGGNALSYRPLLRSALVLNSVPMVDVVNEVTQRGPFSNVSQTTLKTTAFWPEGMTADGAGWGHGRQCLVWGYPMDGIKASIAILDTLKGTPWATTLSRPQVDALMNYLRGSMFYFYKGYVPPIVSRGNMYKGDGKPKNPPPKPIANWLLKNWCSSLTPDEMTELKQYVQEAGNNEAFMLSQPNGVYHGTRYFFNNDDMIRKTKDYYVMVNMASSRVSGLESWWPNAAGFNFYSCDGVTLLQHHGDEYAKAIGAFNLNAWPGITSRQTTEPLKPITNWNGYRSTFDFAAGATSGSDFATGFIFRKTGPLNPDPNPYIFGVLAYKSWFMFDDILLALGAGITNEEPKFGGDIWTTLDQTCLTADSKTVSANGLDWQVNNQFSYAVLPQYTIGTPIVKREKRMSKWHELSQGNKGPEEEIGIFEMAINHGYDVKDATYAYVVDCMGQTDKPLPKVLSNTTSLQAGENANGTSLGAVFFSESAELASGRGLFKVSAPCALLVEYDDANSTAKITVTDAKMDMSLAMITVSTPFPATPKVEITMPTEPFRGKPASVVVQVRR